MENERLLSEQEISKALTVSAEFVSENAWSFGPLTVAQDAKSIAARDKWWIQTVGEDIIEVFLNLPMNEANKATLLKTWQSLKQSLEVKE